MKIIDTSAVKAFIRICKDGWRLGYHERNAGNLSYRMREDEVDACRPFFSREPKLWVPIGVSAVDLSGEYFIVTCAGKHFRNIAREPEQNICILEINDIGDSYRIVWGLEKGGSPTSELQTHFLNHATRLKATSGACRVIYHAHTSAIVALTYLVPLNDNDLTRILWQSETECPIVFPQGVGIIPWMMPGGKEIAYASCDKMKVYNAVIWAHHGTFCAGPDFDTAFGLMETLEKAADIYLKILGTGQPIRQSITDENIRAIALEYELPLRNDFLLDK